MNNSSDGNPGHPDKEAHIALLRAARLCHPDWEHVGRVTFLPVRDAIPWSAWKKDIFVPILRPKLEEVLRACAQTDGRTVEACDCALDQLLTPDAATRSRRAGHLLATGFTVPNGEKFWRRAKDRIVADEIPGHLATVLVLRAAAFHLPPALVIGSYVLAEARGGLGLDQLPLCAQMVDACLAGGSENFALRAA